MLQLNHIVKDYPAGGSVVHALRGVTLTFRRQEFVAILGPSGCGKTTLLNIIGGLDQYTSGDLLISGRSTKDFRDRDWDAYRNHSIGFVFQSYNLIPHQSVLRNVELALTLSGVSRRERRARAVRALERVGLGDQLNKKPNQMSGGQMQRVAIARALVNDPEILLADEPTGALDSETSVQVMDILREISREKLVIMVTHNPELASKYATRTIRLLDGSVVSDSAPCSADEAAAMTAAPAAPQGRTSMSFFTALGLSLNNLMTKKTRTILTAFAGSIGIIGIALILSLSNGIQNYIDDVQEDTLSSYPVTIEAESTDMSAMVTAMMGENSKKDETEHEDGRIYASTVMYELMNSLNSAETQTNNLRRFKEYLDDPESPIHGSLSAIQYSYDLTLPIYTTDSDGNIVKADVMQLLQNMMSAMYGGDSHLAGTASAGCTATRAPPMPSVAAMPSLRAYLVRGVAIVHASRSVQEWRDRPEVCTRPRGWRHVIDPYLFRKFGGDGIIRLGVARRLERDAGSWTLVRAGPGYREPGARPAAPAGDVAGGPGGPRRRQRAEHSTTRIAA